MLEIFSEDEALGIGFRPVLRRCKAEFRLGDGSRVGLRTGGAMELDLESGSDPSIVDEARDGSKPGR